MVRRSRRGGPGVVGTVARTAVIAGTAQAAAGRVHHRQQQRWAQQQAPAPPPSPPPAATASSSSTGMEERVALLGQLGALLEQGVLTQAEFEAQKAQVLA
jgi:hypothetical protein